MAQKTKARRPAHSGAAKRAPARRPARPRRAGGRRVPALQERDLDLLGLGLVALGIFLGAVMYTGAAGGQAGEGTASAVRFVMGGIAYVAPAALVAGGVLVVARAYLPAGRPLRTGAVLVFAAVALALAAGTFGLGPPGARTGVWTASFVEARGGVIGEALYTGAAALVSQVGAHILAVFLFLAGLLLVTGASVATVVANTGHRVRGTAVALRDTGSGLATAVSRPRAAEAAADDEAAAAPEPITPPEPDEDAELVVRATHVEAPPLDGTQRYPDLFGDEHGDAGEADAGDAPDPGTAELDALAGGEAGEEEDPDSGTAPDPADLTPQGRYRDRVTDDPDFEWRIPDPRFLTRSSKEASKPDTSGQEKVAAQLVEALGHFGVESKVVGTVAGPHITRYELRLAPGIKVSKVAQLKDDIAYALAASEIRILAPIPGKQAVGVEVPNLRRRIVHLGDVFQDPPADHSPLTVWLGKDVAGRAIGVDLAKMPHLLVAGTTGAGKSGAVNAMLSSVLLRATPHDVRLVLVDPKQVELNHYESIPHLLTPVITSPRMAATALQNLVREMESRYATMSLARTRSLPELNRARERRGEPPLPYVLCVIDELADLMMVAPADVEDSIIRLAQKARAVGIHLVLATQSPRVDVITGMIKANVPSRIAFSVSSQTDSRVILDQNGAESLLGQGDMLFSPVGSSRLQRIQGAYINESEIAQLTSWWRKQGEPEFREELLEEVEDESEADGSGDGFDPDEDPLLGDAIALVAQMGTASTSMLQRRLRLGYTRAGRLIDMLERRGVISGYEGSKPRQVLVSEADLPRVLAALSGGTEPVAPVEVPAGPPADVAEDGEPAV